MTFAYNPIQQSIDTLVNAFIAHARTVDSLTCPLEHMPLSLPSFKSTHIFTARGPMRCGMTHYLLDLFHRSESCFFISPNGRALDIPITARQRVFQVENPAGYGRALQTIYQLENKPQLVLIDNYLDLCGKDSALENLADAMYDEPQARNQFIIGLSTR